ncbi:hypothetical protein DFH08DRAFT_807213 [Mycena albidolilacea]|uniref:Uncharacterized protein n=1 Tax=Mycena albidolilacea TaxID=1033008 RepID=A0AAD7A5K1_9AGAR|nr:hypothetical protein DFH08DRAFT_807213 [Mycena albidolilacea]
MVRVSIVQPSSSTPTCPLKVEESPANKRNSLLAPQEASGSTLGDRCVNNAGGQLHWLQGMQFLILHARLNGQWPALLLQRPSLECRFYDYIAAPPSVLEVLTTICEGREAWGTRQGGSGCHCQQLEEQDVPKNLQNVEELVEKRPR